MSGSLPPSSPPAGVAGGRAPLSTRSKVGLLLGVAGVLTALYLMSGNEPRQRPGEDMGASQGPAGIVRRVEVPLPEMVQPAATPAALPLPAATSGPIFRPRTRQTQRRAEPIMAWEAREEDRREAERGRAGEDAEADESDPLAARLRASRTDTARARRLRDPDLTITAGTIIPCTPQQPLNTQLPGFLSCVVPTEVRGTTGRVVLLDRGTRIVGQMQRQMSHGTNRAFILWTRAETPDGVVVDLGSPGTDALGQNGLDVETVTNFWSRFGGAIMLSFIDAGLQAAAIGLANSLSPSNGQSLNFFQMQSGGSSAAARALDATVSIPPYGTRPHGEPAAVFVARDLSFAEVYQLRSAR